MTSSITGSEALSEETDPEQSQAIVDEFLSDLFYQFIEKGEEGIDLEKVETKLSKNPDLKLKIAHVLKTSKDLKEQTVEAVKQLNNDKEVNISELGVVQLSNDGQKTSVLPIPVSQEIPLNIDYIEPDELDPSVITNRMVADKYVRRVLMKDPEVRSNLKRLKAKQKKHELEMFGRRKGIIAAIKKEVAEEDAKKNASQILKKFSSDKSAKIIQQRLQEAYKKSDLSTLKFFQNLYADFHTQFKKMKVPFFCLRKELYYENYKEDRKYIVQLIDDLISDN